MKEYGKKLFVISGPTGAGAGDIVASVMEHRKDIGSVIPVTARKMRAGEINGKGFFFYDLDGWKELKEKGDLLEQTVFAGNDYGTSRSLVEQQLAAGKNVILTLEAERAAQIKKNMPEAVCVYIEPSSEELLRARYEQLSRSSFEVSARMDMAAEQKKISGFCDYTIFSDDAVRAAQELELLIDRLTQTEG